MPRRRLITLLAAPIAAALAIGAACTFPTPNFDATDASAQPDVQTGGEGGLPDGALGGDGNVDVDGAVVVKDAGGRVEAGACSADASACDCDGDDFLDKNKPACAAGRDAATLDCDDLDERASPGLQGYLEDPEEPPLNGNWNCDSKREPLYKDNIDCSKVPTGECNSTFGFESANVKCGAKGIPFVTCRNDCIAVLCSCVVASRDITHVQACK